MDRIKRYMFVAKLVEYQNESNVIDAVVVDALSDEHAYMQLMGMRDILADYAARRHPDMVSVWKMADLQLFEPFEFNGVMIEDPLRDESGREWVDPVRYYGLRNIVGE